LAAVPSAQPQLVAAYGKLPLSFEANQGQTDASVKFVSRGRGYALFLTATEAVLELRISDFGLRNGSRERATAASPSQQPAIRNPSRRSRDPQSEVAGPESAIRNPKSEILRLRLVGANPSPRVRGLDELPGKSNYFIGNDPSKWRTNVPTYAKVECRQVYPGVNLVYYGNQQQLEHDFVVEPGADPSAIRLAIEGADKLEVDAAGDLVLHAAGGDVRLRKPVLYQEVEGVRREIAAGYVLGSGIPPGAGGTRGVPRARFSRSGVPTPALHRQSETVEVSFEVGAYDRAQALVIDPVLVYSTYLGGSSEDYGFGIAVDSAGNAYVTGRTASTNFPTASPLQAAYGGSDWDAFVAKLNAAGSALVYSTYLGGSGSDELGFGIAVDSAGNAYVAGQTTSTNFPTASPLQAASGGGYDAFVAKLNAAGSALLYSTYLGGSGGDFGQGIAVDSSGNAYVMGRTNSTNFPTASPLQATYGGAGDAFVAKLNAAGSALVYSTYLGGSGSDGGLGIAVDSSGNAYVTGCTFSTNFPTVSPLQAASGGGGDAFAAKLNAAGSALLYSTYLGGSGEDSGLGIAVDSPGNAYVTGNTTSTNFPTASPLQPAFVGGSTDAFVAKLNAADSGLVYSTYLGGSGADCGTGIAVDSSSNAYVTGSTSSTNFPTASPLQATYGGNIDAFVVKLNAAGSALAYSTYLGGSGNDSGLGIALDASGNAYVTGYTGSTDFPTASPLQPAFGGGYDAFVAKITQPNDNFADARPIGAVPFTDTVDTSQYSTEATDPSSTCAGGKKIATAWYSFTPSVNGGFIADTFGSSYDTVLSVWTGSPGSFTQVACNDDTSGTQSQVGISVTAGVTYYFMVSAYSTAGTLVFHLTTIPAPAITSISPSSVPSGASSVYITVTGTGFISSSVVRWNGADRSSYYHSPTELAFYANNTDVAEAGTAQITVYTPGAGTSNAVTFTITSNPVPTITSLSPSSASAGSSSVYVTITGTGFTVASEVRWNGVKASSYSFHSSTEMAFWPPSADLAQAGTGLVTVYNPPTGGGTSNAATFTITSNPVPTITSLSPSSAPSGASSVYVTITGTGFTIASEVRWNGAKASSYSFHSSTEMAFWPPSASLAQAGTAQVTVYNPPTGGGTSNAVTFTIESNPVPTITSLSPSCAQAGASSVYVYITGAGFNVASEVRWNGAKASSYSFHSSTEMAFWPPSADLAQAGTAQVTVYNPPTGGGTSNAAVFTITTNPIPSISYLSPSSKTVGSSNFTLTVNGSNFSASSVVRWNGANRATTFGSATQLTAAISADDVATAGTALVTVFDGAAPPAGGGTSTAVTFSINNPSPVLTLMSPLSAGAGGDGFNLTLTGSGFVSQSVVRWGGSDRATTFISGTQLVAAILSSDIAEAGSVQVRVYNPGPGGGTSSVLNFTIVAPNPAPSVTTLSPASAVAGGATFTLTVNGTNFVNGAVIRWNGAGRTTTFVSATQLTTSIAAADIASPVTALVTVFNPAPGGGTSNTVMFPVGNPVPVITSLSPSSMLVSSSGGGSFPFTLTVNGTGFISSSVVRWNGMDRSTTYVSGTQLKASIGEGDVFMAGTAQVTVFNPAPAGGTSSSATFTVNNPAPTLTALNPSSKGAGESAFTLAVTGTNFVDGSVVRWNGNDRSTTFISGTSLEAAIAAGDIAAAGTAVATVFNPAPGGGLSSGLTFTIGTANPVPTISSITPTSRAKGGASFYLTVNGTGFISASQVCGFASGCKPPSSLTGSTQLTVFISSTDLSVDAVVDVTVVNPAPGGGTSNAAKFTIGSANPVPAITSLEPSGATAGSGTFTLTVNGSGFVSGSVVQWNGTNLTTSFVSASQVTASVPGANVAAAGTAQVTVFSPAPGGGTSNASAFTVSNPVPAIASLSPPTAVLGGPAFTLTVTGSGFVNGSVVRWNGADRLTVVGSGTQLTASVLASDIAATGTAQVTVFNPSPGGGTSNAVAFSITQSAVPVAIVKISGDDQSGAVGTTLAAPLVVQVNDAAGAGIAGVTVNFAVTSGSGTLSTGSAVTNGSGQAQVALTLGTKPEQVSVAASVAGVSPPVVFTATAQVGPPASLEIASGNSQAALFGTALANPLVVKVTDQFGNLVSGVAVVFTVASGAGSISVASATTGSDGLAQVTWTLGGIGANNLVHASFGTLTPVTFAATSLAPSSLVIVSGNNHSAPAGIALPEPLVVAVVDQFDNPLGGASVHFTIGSGAGSLSPTLTITGANGQAQTVLTLGASTGTVTVSVSVTGLATVVIFNEVATAGPPAALAIVSGNNQTAVAGSTLPGALVVQVSDQYGNPVPNVAVGFAVASGGGSLSAATANTGADGQAQVRWTLGSVAGVNTTQATVGTLAAVTFTASGAAAETVQGTVSAGASQGAPGGVAHVPLTLTLNDGISLDSLSLGLRVDANGAAPSLADRITFDKDAGMPDPSLVDESGPLNTVSVAWMGMKSALSGTVRLGEVLVPIPAQAADGHTYTVRITGANGAIGMTSITVAAGTDAVLSVSSLSYLVGDTYPFLTDKNADNDTDDAGEFGDNKLNLLDLILALRAVTGITGYRPPTCADRFDAMDAYPADTPTVRGGDAKLSIVDLIITLRRVTGVDTSKWRRYSRNQVCPAGEGLVAMRAVPGASAPDSGGSEGQAARVELGTAVKDELGRVRIPLYLVARSEAALAGMGFAVGFEGEARVRLRFVANEAFQAPSLVDDGVPGVLALAWLEGFRITAGERLLLGWVEAVGTTPALRVYGFDAPAESGTGARGEIQ
jgi:hypothetical protein